jgi:alkanesulfonate monooxygenase SsuD/methylene tetrahydromethanopterin reductase-like flavin-dependent oxidoreductase (luciferase family)
MMSFGLFLNAGAQLGRTHRDVYEVVLEEARLAETLGYHDVWISEHHFIPFGINSNALTLAGFILGQTKRLRVGTAVTLAPQYHPVQLAEQVAILDQCSGGRLDFGIGRGGYLRDFEVFSVDTARWDAEIEESARVLLDAWSQEETASDSAWFKFSPTSIYPRRPVKTQSPLFLATSTPKGIAFAAEHGLPLLHYWGTPVEQRLKVEMLYGEHAPRGPGTQHVHTLIVLVSDDEAATRAALRDALTTSFHAGDWPHVPQAKNRHVDAEGKPISREVMAEFIAMSAIVGPPQKIATELGDLQAATGASRFVLYMEAIAERETILRSVRRFATEVMPLMGVGENAAE